uniref:Coatomer subunit beta' n=1 Tax=Oryzias latipes TaxID=8090 RepID=A0A3P9KBP6_ORYLA
MPLRLEIKRWLTARSERVKSVDLHSTEPWMLVSLYNGTVMVWNHDTQLMVKTFEVCHLPVRVAKFVARKHWIIAGADDMFVRVFNYNTLEKVNMFEAHSDYIRCILVHPTQPYILSSSDDMLIKLWDWEREWLCSQLFEGHTHYVMQMVINPKDNNQFASASLDRTIKVWQLGSRTPNFTLEGHEKGVNCVDYYSGGDKPYLISGADDHLVKIWDYQNKTCVQTLEGHMQNVTGVSFHPELPVILTGSEDGTVRVWHSNIYRLENSLNYDMNRVWCICGRPGTNYVAVGCDEGSIIIKLGREEPAMSMDSSGKVMWARHSEVEQASLRTLGDTEVKDGERLPLGLKDMGSCEIYPQTLQHSPNGRFVVVSGDGEFIIYTAVALRSKSFGSAEEFVWAHDSSQYATREGNNVVKIFKNFKPKKTFKPSFGAEEIFGGFLLGVKSNNGLAFYDWENLHLIRRVEIQPKHIFWSESGKLLCIATDESFFLLRFLPEQISAAQESKDRMTEDGIEDAFEVVGEVQEVVKTGLWVGDCFIYTSSLNRLQYYVGGEIITIAHLDRIMYLLGYIPKDNRLYLGDKELNIISYALLLSVLEYQTAVMRKDFCTADKVLPTIPKDQRTRVARFLEKQGYRAQALAVSTDPEHKFELALQLEDLITAHQLVLEAESQQKWRQLAELTTTKCQLTLAQECLHRARDYGGLLLLATTSGNVEMVGKLAEGAEKDGRTNVAFLSYFIQGRLEKCLDLLIETDRLPEAALLARTYIPSQVSRVVKLWKESLSKVNRKAADALADPAEYSNLFPEIQQSLLAEQYLKETGVRVRPSAEYPLVTPNEDRHVLEECRAFRPEADISKPAELEVVKTEVELPVPAVLTELPHSEETAQEEPVTLEQESTTAERGEPAHVQSIPSEGEATEDYTNSTSEEGFSQPEMVQSSPVQNVQSTACKFLNDSNLTGEELPSEAAAAAAELSISADSEASEETSNHNDLEAGTTSSQVSAVMEKSLSELALGPELSHTATEEFPSFQTAGSRDSPNVESAAEGGLVLPKQEQGKQSVGLTLEPEEEPEQEVPLEVCAMKEPPAGSNEDEGESEESAEDLEGEVADEDLDDLDMENLDLTDVWLEEDLLSE